MKMRIKKVSYLSLVWIIMALSGVVFIEPAPVDVGIMLLFVLGLVFSRLRFKDNLKPALVLLFVFLMANILSLIFTTGFLYGLRYFLITTYLVISLIFFVGIVDRYGQKGVEVLFSGYCVAAVASALLGLGVYFSILPDFAQILKYGRMAGLFKDPNVFGPFMIPPALYAISRMEKKGEKKLVWAGVLIITSLAILLSYSRAAWGGYAVALTVYLVFRFVRRPTLKQVFRGIILLALVAAVIIYMYRIPSVQASLKNRFALQSYDTERFDKQLEAIRMSRNYPLGAGPGQTGNVINYSTHNSYIMILLENGLIGMLSYVLLLLSSLWLSFKKARRTNNAVYIIAFACIVSILGVSLVIDVVHWRHWWFILAIPWFSYKHLSRNSKKPSTDQVYPVTAVHYQFAAGDPAEVELGGHDLGDSDGMDVPEFYVMQSLAEMKASFKAESQAGAEAQASWNTPVVGEETAGSIDPDGSPGEPKHLDGTELMDLERTELIDPESQKLEDPARKEAGSPKVGKPKMGYKEPRPNRPK